MKRILVAGTGRMGKGLALAFAYAGHPVILADTEERTASGFRGLAESVREELARDLGFLCEADVLTPSQADAILKGIRIVARPDATEHIRLADFVFEAVTELREIKQEVYAWLNAHLPKRAVVSSTTSTMAADELAEFIDHPQRFVNAHWLNPAYLIPLVEVSRGARTSTDSVAAMMSLLTAIGKVPVECKSSPGFIVPRIQAVAMNEAARLVEEKVATAEQVDLAVRAGFGIRFATLGLLEFIDWGGGDILYHATRYLGRNIDAQRFSVPDVVRENMENQRNGMRDGAGFYAWEDIDIDAYRNQRLAEFVELLRHRELMPQPGVRVAATTEDDTGETQGA